MLVLKQNPANIKVSSLIAHRLAQHAVTFSLVVDIDEWDKSVASCEPLMRLKELASDQLFYDGNLSDYLTAGTIESKALSTNTCSQELLSSIQAMMEPILEQLNIPVLNAHPKLYMPTTKSQVDSLIEALDTYKYTLDSTDLQEFI